MDASQGIVLEAQQHLHNVHTAMPPSAATQVNDNAYHLLGVKSPRRGVFKLREDIPSLPICSASIDFHLGSII